MGFGPNSSEYKQAEKAGFKSGKHNGRSFGAFGGKIAAKAHRSLYLKTA